MKKKIKILNDVFYLKDGLLHNDKGPSIEFNSGTLIWMKKGKIHRDNGPAILDKNEINKYWINGEPAVDEEIKNIKRNKWIDDFLI